jgi:hypothetical protein
MNILAAILIVVFGMIITVRHILKCLDNEDDSI